jgi:hypothetical protein
MVLGCGSSGHGAIKAGADSGPAVEGGAEAMLAIDGGTLIADLTSVQQGALCDWAVGELGGYGTANSCNGNVDNQANPANQAQCVAGSMLISQDCAVTVEQLEECIIASGGCPVSVQACRQVLQCGGWAY